ncbi:hypothetical protein [Chryseobacterium echinoideorum]|uniref:hypothetical protein n=1 Tax=Chryseobacterium echinoideorum TaxID=1549648 RepID=UPI001184C1DA|nr:hypothetical protein [Chryseobacterium echinoideorum]
MRKILVLIVFGFLTNLKAQNESQLPSLNITAPTASGIASKIKSPSAISTGIPDIGIPFFTLPTHNKNVSINIGLSYHPNNTFMGSKASDVGLGWNLAGASNVIYREINSGGTPSYNYHFNFLGKSGTFQFSKHPQYGILDLKKVTENRYKITVNEIATNIYNFKIVDENGISYHFETLDSSYYPSGYDVFSSFTACYYLTKIIDTNGEELVLFNYQEDSYTIPAYLGGPNTLIVKSLKVNNILSKDFGNIAFSYNFNSNDRKSYQDPFKLNSIILKNTAGKTTERYVFETIDIGQEYHLGYIANGNPGPCAIYERQGKRMLTKLYKYGSGSTYETTQFTYPDYFDNLSFGNNWTEYPSLDPINKCFKEEHKNPKFLGQALLKSIKYPNGTEVKYTFEPNQYYVDKNFAGYLFPYEISDRDAQYFEEIGDFGFNFNNGNTSISFNLPYNPDEPDGYSYLFEHLAVGTLYTDGPFQPSDGNYFINGAISNSTQDMWGYKKYPPGNNTIVISGTGGTGTYHVKRIRLKSNPIANYSTGKGVRIKQIEFLENNVVNSALTRKFSYGKFDGSIPTSGYLNEIDGQEFVVYKNVKEVLGENQGYTKYYYKTLHDPADSSSPPAPANELRNVNILANGLLEKREVYNAAHLLIQRDSILSKLSPLSFFEGGGSFDGQYYDALRNGIVEEQKTISTIYNSSGSFTNTAETVRDMNHYNVKYEKITGADGTVTESNITYPFGRSNRLWNANIRSIPVIVETKRNGTVISKAETRFEDVTHFYPTSQISFLPDNLSQSLKNVSYDLYDDKGNLVQFTAFPEVGSAGVPTTIIYGYNKTMPIAKIEGAKLSDVPSSLITAIVSASNEDANAPAAQEEAKEQALIAALNTFKNNAALENFMVTCYTYNPLVGITTTIPPNGMMELYKYDSFNRLLKVVDVNGNTVKEHQYNYKQ